VRFYERYLFPVSRQPDRVFKGAIGRHLIAIRLPSWVKIDTTSAQWDNVEIDSALRAFAAHKRSNTIEGKHSA
jgi:hypothetical protein